MTVRHESSFAGGVVCGIVLGIAGSTFLSQALGNESQQSADTDRQIFVTGDTRNGTAWLLESDGTLTCLSRNSCRAPVYWQDDPADRDRDRDDDERVPQGPRVPSGPSVPGGPSVPSGPSVPRD